MDCPDCGSPLTLEVGPERPLSMSLRDAVLAAETDECIEITQDCWDCGWQKIRQVRVESIDTTAGDETVVERATLREEIAAELAAIEAVATLEDALAEIRQHRQLEVHPTEQGENAPE